MSDRTRHIVSRRTALAGFAIAAACGSVLRRAGADAVTAETGVGPIFSPSGPSAELYGAAEGILSPILVWLDGRAIRMNLNIGWARSVTSTNFSRRDVSSRAGNTLGV